MKLDKSFIFSCSWLATIAYLIVVPIIPSNFLATMIWLPMVGLNLLFCIINMKLISQRVKVICLVLLFIMFASMLLGDKLLSKDHYVAMVVLINSLLSISLYANITISKKTKVFIKRCAILLGLLFVLYSFTPIAYKATRDGVSRVIPYYVFNLGNANMAGIYLFLIFSILFIFTFDADRFYKKVVFIALDAYIVYLIYGTGARACIIAVLALLLVGLWYGNRKINRYIIYAITVVPMVFMYVLVELYTSGYKEIDILGKGIFTGREVYFKECIEGIDSLSKWLFGDFATWGLNNAHNAPLAILLSLGLVGVILVYLAYYDMLFKINHDSNVGKMKAICVVSILCLFVQSMAEAALFLGGFPGVNFICTMIILSKESTEEREARIRGLHSA